MRNPRSRALLALAALSLFVAGGAHAQQPSQQSKPTCKCFCNSSGGVKEMSYNAIAACSSYEGKTCNYLGPDNRLRTGSLVGCESGGNGGVASTSTAGVRTADPKPKPYRPAASVSQKPAASK
jgi:hypothetical protein